MGCIACVHQTPLVTVALHAADAATTCPANRMARSQVLEKQLSYGMRESVSKEIVVDDTNLDVFAVFCDSGFAHGDLSW